MANVTLAPVHTRLLKSWTMLAASNIGVSHTGDTVETPLVIYALPAATMGPNGMLKIMTLWSMTSNANAKTLRTRLGASGIGGTAIFSFGVTTSAGAQCFAMIRNRNAQNSQISNPGNMAGFGGSSLAPVASTIDTSAAQNVVITGQCAVGTDTITLEAYLIELLYGP